MMPLPPSTTSFPPNNIAPERRSYRVNNRLPGGGMSIRGPYLCTRVPVSGSLQMTQPGTAQMVMIEERVYLPLDSGCKARSVLVDVQSNVAWEVIFVRRLRDHIEAFVKSGKAT